MRPGLFFRGTKAVEKHFARLKANGILRGIGPDKGGR